ncbi:multiple inositol polyphosphate phosphatase 1-like isoform X1 [Acipenser ruthenus]|uniref:multiple inositol polyphosphate phosphatase 1-like isoform X1 n=1 Tax=Acipenser ruthenus TaxID=7906 RepID=UPI00145A2075|nr:multiple inositol polyphosphate phosphatase 1-like isoform X1 [Acipenser ruthenus]
MAVVLNRHVVLLTFAFTRFCSAGNLVANREHQTGDIPAIAKYFGTKTRYEEINPYLLNDILFVNKTSLQLQQECTPVHISAVIRHGTRFPTAKNVKMMKDIYKIATKTKRRGLGLVDDISHWDMWYNDTMDGQLVKKGRDDHMNLAFRLATAYPSLFTEDSFRDCRMKFITSSKHRCVDSTLSFIDGLVMKYWKMQDGRKGNNLHCQLEVNDDLMRFFDKCERFVVDVEENKTALQQVDLFKTKPEMQGVLDKVASLLDIAASDITADLVEAAFYMCSYDLSIRNLKSPWCQLFDQEDAKVLEYANDLKQYWKRGYGHEINSKSSCTLFHDLFRRLDKAVEESERSGTVSEPAAFQIGHAETLLPLLSLMGFFKDETPLTADNFAQQGGRVFRTGHIVPYASNLVFILHRCEGSYRLQLLLNEKPLSFPQTDDPAPEYQHVKNLYSNLLEGCDFKKECKLPSANGTVNPIIHEL